MSYFDFLPEDAFSFLMLFFPIEKLETEKFNRIIPNDSWALLWKRDLDDHPPPDPESIVFEGSIEENYLEFVSEYNTQETNHDKFYIAIRWRAIGIIKRSQNILFNKNNALMAAIYNDHLDLVKYFVSLGADITADNNAALNSAAGNGNLDIVIYLVEQGADVSAEMIRMTSACGHANIVNVLETSIRTE